jgi:hypothetical protein
LITHGGASRVLHFEPVGRASRAITEPVTRHVELGDIRLHVGAEFLEPVSIELDVGGADHLGPLGCFLAHVVGHLLGRALQQLGASVDQLLAHDRVRDSRMTASGVFAGTTKPCQGQASKPASPGTAATGGTVMTA